MGPKLPKQTNEEKTLFSKDYLTGSFLRPWSHCKRNLNWVYTVCKLLWKIMLASPYTCHFFRIFSKPLAPDTWYFVFAHQIHKPFLQHFLFKYSSRYTSVQRWILKVCRLYRSVHKWYIMYMYIFEWIQHSFLTN